MADTTDKALDALQKWARAYRALRRERDALRAQLATAQKEIDRCHARLEITHEWRADETGELVKVPVADPAAHPDAVYCRDATIELMQDQIETLEQRLATARAGALREAAALMSVGGRHTIKARTDAILSLIDTPTPSAPSPEAVARAALEHCALRIDVLVEEDETGDQSFDSGWDAASEAAADTARFLASHPESIAAIVAKAGGGE